MSELEFGMLCGVLALALIPAACNGLIKLIKAWRNR